MVIHVMKFGKHIKKRGEMNAAGEGDRKENSRFWGILNVLIKGISGDESGITHHRLITHGKGFIRIV